MSLPAKTVSTETGRTFKLGRRIPVAPAPVLPLARYLYRTLPTPPATCDYTAKALPVLAQMLGNDTMGDCTAAAAFHIAGVVLGNAGIPVIWDDKKDIIPFYSATGGFVPGQPKTDRGADIVTVLNYWRHIGLPNHKIYAYLAVNPRDQEECATAIWLFENLYKGVALPDIGVNPAPENSGFLWGLNGDADPNNGHALPSFGYNLSGTTDCTWGLLGTMTWPAIAEYCSHKNYGELFTVLSLESLIKATQKAPNGFDAEQLMHHIQLLA